MFDAIFSLLYFHKKNFVNLFSINFFGISAIFFICWEIYWKWWIYSKSWVYWRGRKFWEWIKVLLWDLQWFWRCTGINLWFKTFEIQFAIVYYKFAHHRSNWSGIIFFTSSSHYKLPITQFSLSMNEKINPNAPFSNYTDFDFNRIVNCLSTLKIDWYQISIIKEPIKIIYCHLTCRILMERTFVKREKIKFWIIDVWKELCTIDYADF